jgi:hypothetical protein
VRGLINMLKGRHALRGRVSRVALVLSGEVSVTMRFGLDELEAAKALLPGVLVEVVVIAEKKPDPAPKKRAPRKKPDPQLSIPGAGGPDGS